MQIVRFVDVVFTAPPGGENHPPALFLSWEDDQGRSVDLGEWVQRDDGSWVLRIPYGLPPEWQDVVHDAHCA